MRALTAADPNCTVTAIDGISAFDTMHRKAMLSSLRRDGQLSELVPFVRLFCGQPSVCSSVTR